MNSEEENKDFIYVDGRKMFLHEDTKEIVATITFPDYPHIEEKLPLKIVGKINGFWIDENNKKLSQNKGLNETIFYGGKVKIKLMTTNVPDERKIEVEIKAKQGDKYIDLKTNTKTLKFTVKVKNNQAISNPFYLDPNWYNEEIEKYNYKTHQTEINANKALTFVFEAKFVDSNRVYELPNEDSDKLKPITYRRNYEELIGLFNTDNGGEKDKEKNYENKFINGKNNNSAFKTIADEFKEKVTTQNITTSELKTLVEEKATALWNAAVKQVQSGNLDDRPLYWARNKMQTWLKRNPLFKDQIDFDKSIVKKGTELDDLIIMFEEKSRNYTGIDFSKAGNKKKILITGFDPFQLNPDINFNSSMGANSATTFNPSGIIALCFDGIFENYYIQTCIFPVRYEDFDKGFVENVIKANIKDADLIMTTSLNGGNPRFDIEKFATEFRGGFHDNLVIGNSDNQYNSSRFTANQSQNYTETTIPDKKIFGDKTSIILKGNEVYFDTNRSPEEGSGSNYLSNEIMYRSTKVRDQIGSKIPVGHFHLGNLRSISRANEVKNVVFEIIKRILK
jgi:pyrrolidone-carboxylate peptidase